MRVALVVLALCASCAFDPARHSRPARMQVGAQVRHFPAGQQVPMLAFKAAEQPTRTTTESHEAFLAAFSFTMSMRGAMYVGGELEAGMLETRSSNAAGGYAVFGAKLPFGKSSLAAEVAGGYRTVRFGIDTEDLERVVVEPRVRGEVWLGPRVTLSASAGWTIGDQQIWMAGAAIGIHQSDFDEWKR
jgi:hypothetical protein